MSTDTAVKAAPTTTFRIRLSPTDVAALKDIARHESVRQGVDLGWCDLIRAAIKTMVRDRAPII